MVCWSGASTSPYRGNTGTWLPGVMACTSTRQLRSVAVTSAGSGRVAFRAIKTSTPTARMIRGNRRFNIARFLVPVGRAGDDCPALRQIRTGWSAVSNPLAAGQGVVQQRHHNHREQRGHGQPEHQRNRQAVERSEERRVGKECRSRWWPYHEKENESKG